MNSTLLAERLIDTADICNARQLGGYIAADGRRIRAGLLIRTGGLDKISEETVRKLSEKYKVRVVVDFRFGYETLRFPDKEIPGAENIQISLFEMDMNAPQTKDMFKRVTAAGNDELRKLVEFAKTGQMATLYSDILQSEQSCKGFAQFFRILLENTGGAVLWHCTHGKDRTGVAAALVMYALGADDDTVMQDFLLTNEINKDKIEALREKLEKTDCDKRAADEAQAIAGVKGEYLKAAFDEIKAEYGSVLEFIKVKLGVSDEDIGKLRDMYLE